MTATCVRLEKVSVLAEKRRILDVEYLNVPREKFFAVIGPNGAGKTTLLRVISALQRPHNGRVEVLGKTITAMAKWHLPLIRRKIALVPQTVHYNPSVPLTLNEVVYMGVAGVTGLLKKPDPGKRDLVDKWINHLGLSKLRYQPFAGLSGGERQKTLLARAMVQEPELLLLDEPTANLDMDWKKRLSETFEEIYLEGGLTVIMVTHETQHIPRSCREAALMKAGKIVQCAERKRALSEESLTVLFDEATSSLSPDSREIPKAGTS